MYFQLSTSPFVHQPSGNIATVMRSVLLALLPGIAAYVWLFGWGIVINILLASVTALGCEALVLWLRRRPIVATLQDNSALVTAWLLAIALPPFVPWWMTVLATSFGMIFSKHLYGGLGYNPFNPAMVGYVVLLISFPLEMAHFPGLSSLGKVYPSFMDSVNLIFLGHEAAGLTLDAVSGATSLDTMKTGLNQYHTVAEIQHNPLFGSWGGKGWETINVIFLLGGIWLAITKVCDWRIPVSLISTLFLIAAIFSIIDSDRYPSAMFHIFSGATIFGAFFIATDPVTAATSAKGRWVYGAGIGILTYVIRTWGGYPDGVAFAILLMNMNAPTIDYLTRPAVFGSGKRD